MPRFFSYIVFTVILLNDTNAVTVFELNPEIVKAYQAAIDFDITSMDLCLAGLRSRELSNGFLPLLENYRETIILLTDENQKAYRAALGARSERIDQLKLAPDNSPYKTWCLSEIYLQWALIRIRYHDEIRAANDLRKANNYIKECVKRFPWFVISNKTLSVIEAMASAVPDQYKWLASLAGIEGEQGVALTRLNKLKAEISKTKKFHFLNREINFYILFITQNLNPTEISLIKSPAPDSLSKGLTLFSEIWIDSKNGRSDEVIRKCEVLKKSIRGLRFCYLNYLKGEAQLNLLQNPIHSLTEFLECTNGDSFVKSAYRRIAWFYLIDNQPELYRRYINKVRESGSEYLDDDKQAQLEAVERYKPNISLLKSRLLFDGGKYQESIKVLDDETGIFLSLSEKSEFHYRKGRCLQKLNSTSYAVDELKKSILIGRELNQYFASSAALQIALIKRNTGQLDSARYFLNLIPSFPKHSYSSSIEMKAAAIAKNLN